MQNTITILNISYAVIVVLLVFTTSQVGFSAYRSTLGGRQFDYKFDKKRLPLFGKVILAELSISFLYAFIVSMLTGNSVTSSLGGATAFSLLLIPPAVLCGLLSVGYAPKDSASKPKKK